MVGYAMKSLADAMGSSGLEEATEAPRKETAVSLPRLARQNFVSTRPATERDRRLALAAVALSALVFLAAIPFAKQALTPLCAFIPSYQAPPVVRDLVTPLLLFRHPPSP